VAWIVACFFASPVGSAASPGSAAFDDPVASIVATNPAAGGRQTEPTAVGAAESTAASDLDEASQLLDEGRPDDARRIAEAVLAADAGSARAHGLLGLALYALQEVEGAERHLRAALADPRDADARLHLAILLLERDENDEAERLLREAAAAAPGNPETAYRLGVAVERRGSLDEAEARYRDALAASPDHGGALFRLAEVARATGRTAEAELLRERHRRSSRHYDERDFLARSTAEDPNDPRTRARLSRVYLALGAVGKAIAEARRAVAASPGSIEALDALAEALDSIPDVDNERIEVRRALASLASEDPERVRDLARELSRAGKRDEAEAVLGQAIAAGLRSASLWTGMGGIEETLRRPDRAENAYREALRIDPSAHEPAQRLAAILTRTGRGGEALETLEASAKAAPGDAARRAGIARLLTGLDRRGEAVAAARAAAAMPAAGAAEHELLGTLLLESAAADGALPDDAALEEAERSLRRALAIDLARPVASHALGMRLLESGRRSEALVHLERASLLRPEVADYAVALRRAREAAGE
jgi:tetratricopeptide (TPR) repeat protein